MTLSRNENALEHTFWFDPARNPSHDPFTHDSYGVSIYEYNPRTRKDIKWVASVDFRPGQEASYTSLYSEYYSDLSVYYCTIDWNPGFTRLAIRLSRPFLESSGSLDRSLASWTPLLRRRLDGRRRLPSLWLRKKMFARDFSAATLDWELSSMFSLCHEKEWKLGFYIDRVSGGDCYHRHLGGSSVARFEASQRHFQTVLTAPIT